MQQGVCVCDIGDVASRADKRVNQTISCIDTDMSLHSKMPIVTLLRLVHCRVALFV